MGATWIHNAEAVRLYNETFFRLPGLWAMVHNFREVVLSGIPLAEKRIARQREALASEIVTDASWATILRDKERFVAEGWPAKIAQAMTEAAMQEAKAIVDAASIILTHSILDAALFDFCRVSALEFPACWESKLKDRQIRFGDIGLNPMTVRDRLLASLLESLERESLPKKCEVLYEVCRPGPGFSALKNYKFDPERIRGIDNERHRLVHGPDVKTPVADCQEEIWYMEQTAMHFWAMLAEAFSLQIDPTFPVQRLQAQQGERSAPEASPVVAPPAETGI